MPSEPQFEYFLSRTSNFVQKDSEIWKTLLPTNRKVFQKSPPQVNGISVTYGEYFDGVRSFLKKNRFKIVQFATSQQINREVKPEDIEKIRICLEKHGEFYHPARIEIIIQGSMIPFVVNVAVSDVGTGCITREFKLLQKMNNDFLRSFLPKVYGQGETKTRSRRKIRMFLGEWFEGFFEFHLTHDPADGKSKIRVWDPEHGKFFLSEDKTRELYSQATMILTNYYNLETFEQIVSWHHAAGDFVIQLQDNTIALKLITVRRYTPMFGKKSVAKSKRDIDLILKALLYFFLNLSIKMRLDRLDGVGDVVWSDDIAVDGFLKGFFDGLEVQPCTRLLPAPADVCFLQYIAFFSEADLYDLSQDCLQSYNPMAPELPVIKWNLKNHIEVLYHALCQVVT